MTTVAHTHSDSGAPHGVAVIGAGWVAKEYLHAVSADPRASIIGVHSRTPDRARTMMTDHGISDGVCFESVAALLADERVDIVILGNPARCPCRACHRCRRGRPACGHREAGRDLHGRHVGDP